jgi:phosphate transport system permease protein
MTKSAAFLVLFLLFGIVLSLGVAAYPAFKTFGYAFLVNSAWNPVTEMFGAGAPIYGTIITSCIAVLIALPLSFGISIFLTELSPEKLKHPLTIAIQLLAGIPSIIFGIWGLFIFVPLMQTWIQPLLIYAFSPIPLLSRLFSGPPYGIGLFTAGCILAIMITPFITGLMCESFEKVPKVVKEAAYGIGCTTSEVVRHVILPYTRSTVSVGVMLGLGRALGETMAVTFVIGNAHRIPFSILAPGTTISATIANEFTEAIDDLYLSSLIALGFILFLITFLVSAAARLLLKRLERR